MLLIFQWFILKKAQFSTFLLQSLWQSRSPVNHLWVIFSIILSLSIKMRQLFMWMFFLHHDSSMNLSELNFFFHDKSNHFFKKLGHLCKIIWCRDPFSELRYSLIPLTFRCLMNNRHLFLNQTWMILYENCTLWLFEFMRYFLLSYYAFTASCVSFFWKMIHIFKRFVL